MKSKSKEAAKDRKARDAVWYHSDVELCVRSIRNAIKCIENHAESLIKLERIEKSGNKSAIQKAKAAEEYAARFHHDACCGAVSDLWILSLGNGNGLGGALSDVAKAANGKLHIGVAMYDDIIKEAFKRAYSKYKPGKGLRLGFKLSPEQIDGALVLVATKCGLSRRLNKRAAIRRAKQLGLLGAASLIK